MIAFKSCIAQKWRILIPILALRNFIKLNIIMLRE
uniref:Uncharacterized protein n=1 Tax=Arundo donax TaxID=35708 RepID=A0A0A9B1C2_ARUDO